ncbi:MAG TPA: hypothetical protein VLV54_18160 [Thermoanaerobaculia bacterium]|nr:hypothetical protein [Thermoanaerobaculia bacterium]
MNKTQLRGWLAASAFFLAAVAPASAGWSPVGGPVELPLEVHLDPGQPELLYARAVVYSDGQAFLWRSEDGGATWRNIQRGLERTSVALAIDPSNPKVIWIWTREGELWRSSDAGNTWSRRFATPSDDIFQLWVFQILADPHDPMTLYRVGSDGSSSSVDVSHDGGESFQKGAPLPIVGPWVQVERGGLVVVDANGLETSSDGGQTWNLRGRYKDGFFGGQIAPSSPGTMYGVGGACLARTDDGGAHWRRLPYPRLSLPNFGCSVLAIDPKDARHVWVGGELITFGSATFFQLSESKDGGETWLSLPRLPRGEMALSVQAAGGDVLYSGRHLSTDGGRTWTRRDRGITTGDARFGLAAQVHTSIGGSLHLVALDAPFGNSPDGLFRSHGGESWKKIPMPEGAASVIDAGAPAVVAAGPGGISRSQDGGDHWHVVPSGPPHAAGLLSDLTRPRYLAVLAFEDIGPFGSVAFWISDDAGATWRRASEGLDIACSHVASVDYCLGFTGYVVDPFDSKRRWVSAEGAFFQAHPPLSLSTDAGASWRVLTEELQEIVTLAADPKIKDRLLAATVGGLFVSEDGGAHWHSLGVGLPDGAIVIHFARDERSATWFAATLADGIYRSTDGGAKWTLLPGAPDRESPAIAIDPRTPGALLTAFRGQGVWRWTP